MQTNRVSLRGSGGLCFALWGLFLENFMLHLFLLATRPDYRRDCAFARAYGLRTPSAKSWLALWGSVSPTGDLDGVTPGLHF